MTARKKIIKLVEQHFSEEFPEIDFIPGKTPVPVSGKVFDAKDVESLIDASLDFWLTEGRFTDLFEEKFSGYLGVNHTVPVNSGSSANLVAFSSLTSEKYGVDKIKKGDEVITVASGFPTTVNPIIQNGCIPVFVDCDKHTYNINIEMMREALSSKTRAVMIAHTLGNPFNVEEVLKFCKENDLFLIEDSCDALGAKYNDQYVGTFGKFGTFSFYPAHHITMGEGGAIITKKGQDKKVLESMRDWGRDCWCAPGQNDTCGRRYDWELGNLPYGYDHKYIYSNIGYNLKLTDLQSAVGVTQIDKLDQFIKARKDNWNYLRNGFEQLNEFFYLPEPTSNSEPSWFGFALTVREDAPFSRAEIVEELDKNLIGSRFIFGGNLLWQPAYQNVEHREVGKLSNSDLVALSSFWIGVFPGLTKQMLDFIIQVVVDFVKTKRSN